MTPELTNWLDEVWTSREQLLVAARTNGVVNVKKLGKLIYGSYGRSLVKNSTATAEDISRFLGELANLEVVLQTAPTVQSSGFVRLPMGTMCDIYIGMGTATLTKAAYTPLTEAQTRNFERGYEVGKSFIHYNHGHGGCSERVYLNVKRPYRVFVFTEVLGPLYHGPDNMPGLVSAKLTGPVGDNRSDSIVIYTRDKAASRDIVARVKDFQVTKGYKYCFGNETPRLTDRAPGLIGTSTGTEPPYFVTTLNRDGSIFACHVGGQSFGSTRADMIAQALEWTVRNPAGLFSSNRTKFRTKVAELFRAVGIDPDAPSNQADVIAPKVQGPLRADGAF